METISPKIWRTIDVLNWSKAYLRDKGVDSPQVEVEWLLREVLNCSRIDIYLHYERPMSSAELTQFRKMLIERAGGKPVQYVVGHTEFMGLTFEVSPDVMIPRPETEVVVEKVIEILKKRAWKKPRIADIGTGSGCIAVSLAVYVPDCWVVACDVSADALTIARRNAENHHVTHRIDFRQIDILKREEIPFAPFHILVSNPPYVSEKMFSELPEIVRKHEPALALTPGGDGLLFYRRLGNLSKKLLTQDGMLVMEIGGTYQEEDVLKVFSTCGLSHSEVVKDYIGQSRGIFAGVAHG